MIPSIDNRTTRRVLVVSLHFPPVNAPDMQRARMALPFLRKQGWEPVVLAVAPDLVEGAVLEPSLESTYAKDIRIIRVRGVPYATTRRAYFGSLWLRCGRAIREAGDKLLASEHFDLVFFTTTQFDAFTLGPRWKAKFNVPYLLDYQDPWVNDYYDRTGVKPPGGKFKFGFSQWMAKLKEPAILRGAAGVISVSPAYGATLARNYKWFDENRVTFLPFGAAERDFDAASTHRPSQPLVSFGDGLVHLVYAGRCGPDMSTSLKILFRAFKIFLAASPDKANLLRFHFIGTDYAPRPLGREWAMPVAREENVESYVDEMCYRVPYYDALYYLTHADALIAVGSNDPTYSASKIFPYVLAHRPLLVIFHELSPVLDMARQMKCCSLFSYSTPDCIDRVAEDVARDWFIEGGMSVVAEPEMSAFRPYSAENMTRQLTECFDAAVARHAMNP
jgi:Glycosyl transferase 4-like domain